VLDLELEAGREMLVRSITRLSARLGDLLQREVANQQCSPAQDRSSPSIQNIENASQGFRVKVAVAMNILVAPQTDQVRR
jgi:hypothetical protein